MTTVAIHQPNFFPWVGYFDKIARADRFVLLDNVQFPRGGSNWGNRVKLLVGGEARWVTAPLDRTRHENCLVSEVQFNPNPAWRDKLTRSVEQSYKRAAFFVEAFALVEPLLQNPEQGLAAYNTRAVLVIAEALGLDLGKIALASSLPGEGAATDLLISLTRAAGGDTYLAGGGAGGYQEDERFAEHGVALAYQDFRHPEYAQIGAGGEFIAGLSIIDPLMNLGIAGTAALLGRLPATISGEPG